MKYNRSRGSVLGFVIVGILLLGLIAGAVYAVRQGMFNGDQQTDIARDTPASEGANSTNNSEKTDESTATQKTNELSEALKRQAAEEQKAKEQNQAAPAQPAAPANETPASTGNSTPTALATTGVSSTPSATLPQTGPAENLALTVLGATLVAGASVAYARSRALI